MVIPCGPGDATTRLTIQVGHATNLAMYNSLPHHRLDDFESIGQATTGPMVVLARLDTMGVAAVSVDRARPEAVRAHLKREIDTFDGSLVRAGVQPN